MANRGPLIYVLKALCCPSTAKGQWAVAFSHARGHTREAEFLWDLRENLRTDLMDIEGEAEDFVESLGLKHKADEDLQRLGDEAYRLRQLNELGKVTPFGRRPSVIAFPIINIRSQ